MTRAEYLYAARALERAAHDRRREASVGDALARYAQAAVLERTARELRARALDVEAPHG